MKFFRCGLAAMLVLSFPVALLAQGGCVNSPENPTALLGLAGAAAAGFAYWRTGGRR